MKLTLTAWEAHALVNLVQAVAALRGGAAAGYAGLFKAHEAWVEATYAADKEVPSPGADLIDVIDRVKRCLEDGDVEQAYEELTAVRTPGDSNSTDSDQRETQPTPHYGVGKQSQAASEPRSEGRPLAAEEGTGPVGGTGPASAADDAGATRTLSQDEWETQKYGAPQSSDDDVVPAVDDEVYFALVNLFNNAQRFQGSDPSIDASLARAAAVLNP